MATSCSCVIDAVLLCVWIMLLWFFHTLFSDWVHDGGKWGIVVLVLVMVITVAAFLTLRLHHMYKATSAPVAAAGPATGAAAAVVAVDNEA